MLSFAQFRPEKDHLKQVEIWKHVLEDKEVPGDAKLVMVGTCRNEADEKIIDDIKAKAKELGVAQSIEIEKNQPR